MHLDLRNMLKDPQAKGVASDFKDHTDPEYVGPGTWNSIHRLAFKARTKHLQQNFVETMKEICQSFPCVNCQYHCSEYIKNHPIEEFVDISIDINDEKLPLGLFVWSWKFHNSVNARLKKPLMSWDTAYNLYSDDSHLVCSETCNHSH